MRLRLLLPLAAALLAAAPVVAAADRTSPSIDPSRFGTKVEDPAFGAFQRGLYITALNIALPRAKEGDKAAMTLVAEIYARGLGVPRNPTEAAKWYGLAAEAGVPEAQFQYALILLDGTLADTDRAKARQLLKAAADAGNLLGQFNFAQFLMDREPGNGGRELAVSYYRKAAEGGLADAQYALSQLITNGIGGLEPDDAEARRWLEKAARQNYDTAQVDLGSWLVEGRGGPRDMKAGFGWIRRAAQGGNVAAQARLAKLYVAGLGVEPDEIEGTAWYILARRAGLSDPFMDDHLQGLTDEEQKKAIERANKLR